MDASVGPPASILPLGRARPPSFFPRAPRRPRLWYDGAVAPIACARCGRSLTPRSERRVPKPVAAATEIAFAFFHGGLWAKETLGDPFCARCVRVVVGLAVLVSGGVLTAASFGLALWLHGPGR